MPNRIRLVGTGASWSTSFGGLAAAATEVYDRVMVPRLFEPWAQLLTDQLDLARGEAVLDVACGPGSVARVAAVRVGAEGAVTGSDLSPAMLALAEAKPPVASAASIKYLVAPADELPVDDAAFDVVSCQQGLQFFSDRTRALAEMRRALRPGGRIGVAVWTEIENSPLFAELAKAIEEIAGSELADRYRGGPWGFPDRAELGALLGQAGFEDVRVSEHVLPVRFEGGPDQVLATLAVTPLAQELDRLTPEQNRALRDRLARRLGDRSIESTTESNIALARR